MDQPVKNTDREIWASADDMKSRSISITAGEAVTLGLNGNNVVMPFEDLHRLAWDDVVRRNEANASPSAARCVHCEVGRHRYLGPIHSDPFHIVGTNVFPCTVSTSNN